MVDVVVCGQLLAAVSHEVLLRHDFGVRYLEELFLFQFMICLLCLICGVWGWGVGVWGEVWGSWF